MLKKLTIHEFNKILNMKTFFIWGILILTPFLGKFLVIKQGYAFHNSIEVFEETISDFIPLLFPLIVALIYANKFTNEQKDNYILYTRTRAPLFEYLFSKLIVNAICSFMISFLLIFIPFLFIVYIEPRLSVINYYEYRVPSQNANTFSFLLNSGNFFYGFIYSVWVGLNGVLYGTLTFLFTLTFKNIYIALSLPFIFYQLLNFLTGIIGHPEFSPISTIFPFNIVKQDLYTVTIPFTLILLLIFYLSFSFKYFKRELILYND